MHNFSDNIIAWFHRHGRKHLPWQQDPTPYEVWVSEIMLQQTQVNTVIPYYERFIQGFPTVEALASATQDEVLHHWAGLGYYARGRNLHKAAQQIVTELGGQFPNTVEALIPLPGIGRSTAGAIVSLGHHERATILDGNVKRVLARFFAIESWPEATQTLKQLWDLAEQLTPHEEVQAYNQAMMDLGATVCTRTQPRCQSCPLGDSCLAHARNLTHALPLSKPKKTLPVKAGQMFVVQREDGAILLHKRSSPGIWGGLWCFPEQLPDSLSCEQGESLGTSPHTFSHYRWEVRLERCLIRQVSTTPENHLWYTAESEPLGLAAIVKQFLNTQRESS
jgi:A/G-specific adenine glycosylase